MEIYTIGFTKRSAADFFGALKKAGIGRLIDVRLRNASQLAGFAKRGDLEFFLEEIVGAEYVYDPALAPTEDLLDGYRKKTVTWDEYERRFLELIRERNITTHLDRSMFAAPTVLLCSELKADRCHRRLVAEYLMNEWGDVEVVHL